MDQCSYCGGALGLDRIDSSDGGLRHYSRITCCDHLLIQRKALELKVNDLQKKVVDLEGDFTYENARAVDSERLYDELRKAAQALLDKLSKSWVGKDYAEYAFSEEANSHPMADLEKLLLEKRVDPVSITTAPVGCICAAILAGKSDEKCLVHTAM